MTDAMNRSMTNGKSLKDIVDNEARHEFDHYSIGEMGQRLDVTERNSVEKIFRCSFSLIAWPRGHPDR
jgi:hypothetical protein